MGPRGQGRVRGSRGGRGHGGQRASSPLAALPARCWVGGGVRGAWASDFDADGRRQAFCFSVKGLRDSGVQALVRGETPTSVGKANGERERDGHGQPGVKPEEEEEEGGRQEWGSLPPPCCCCHGSACPSAQARSRIPNLTGGRRELAHWDARGQKLVPYGSPGPEAPQAPGPAQKTQSQGARRAGG